MFHRVAPAAENKDAADQNKNNKSAPQESASQASPQATSNERNPATQTPSNAQTNEHQAGPITQQRKDTQTMNADSPENKAMPQGGYQPTPAQPSRMDIPGSRPSVQPSAPARAANMYPGSGSAANAPATAYSPTPATVPADGDKKLQIGPGITLSGEIEDCEYLYVEGTVEAALKGARVLEIAEAGAFYGTVEIDEATIAGRFEGDLTVKGRLTIESTGSITGSVAYKELAVEAGASLDGKVTPLDSKGEARVTEGNFAKGKGKRAAADAAQAENELPFSEKAAVNAAE